MSLYKRGRIWYYDFAIAGRRYRGSTREENEKRAQKVESVLIGRAAQREPSLMPRRTPSCPSSQRDFWSGWKHRPSR